MFQWHNDCTRGEQGMSLGGTWMNKFLCSKTGIFSEQKVYDSRGSAGFRMQGKAFQSFCFSILLAFLVQIYTGPLLWPYHRSLCIETFSLFLKSLMFRKNLSKTSIITCSIRLDFVLSQRWRMRLSKRCGLRNGTLTVLMAFPVGKRKKCRRCLTITPWLWLRDCSKMLPQLPHAFYASVQWELRIFAAQISSSRHQTPASGDLMILNNHHQSPFMTFKAAKSQDEAWVSLKPQNWVNHSQWHIERA